MADNTIRCCFLGGKEGDLYVIGEVHKHADVEIAFVYDPDANSVGLEIAEILGIDRIADPGEISGRPDLDYVIVSEPRERYNAQLESLTSTGAKVLSPTEALKVLCGVEPPTAPDVSMDEPYSIDDALTAFERLFDRKKLLGFLLDVAVQSTSADAGSIMMYSADAGELYIAYATGLSERVVRNTRQKLGEGIAGAVAKERKGKLIRDARRKRLYTLDRDRGDIHSAISVPLVFRGELIGVMNVSSTVSERPLTDAGFVTLDRLSGRISRLLFEMNRLQETQARHKEINLRQSMGQLAEKTASPAAKFSMLSSLVGELVGADTAEVYVGTHEGDWLVLGGSNRRISADPDMIKCDRGAISRAFLEQRTIVLTESIPDDSSSLASSFVFVPLRLNDPLGVLLLEFGDRYRLDEFLVIRDSVAVELARFIASERKEHRLRRELAALGRVSDAAPALLTARSVEELCDVMARLVADALDCERVSVRLQPEESDVGKIARFEGGTLKSPTWAEEDEERFLKLKKKGATYSVAFLDFQPETIDAAPAYHSLIAVPVEFEDRFSGGVIAYDKRAASALEQATFSDLDEVVIDHIVSIAIPVVRGILRGTAGEGIDEPSYDSLLAGNVQRMKRVLESEMSRADRYHNAFSLLVLQVKPLEQLIDDDYTQALSLIDEITRGIQTRTRKTDYGTWISRDTFAMLSLEGTRRIRFLISRLMIYLLKDFSAAGLPAIDPDHVRVGQAIYPGTARTPEALIEEAELTVAPYNTAE